MEFKYRWTYKEQYPKIDKLILEHLKKKWEKWDWRIKKTRNKKKYKILDYQYRTRKTLYGMVTYKRRIYEYFDEELQKWIRVCLVDEILQLPKYKRIGEDVEQTIIEYFAYGKRYHDICAICKKAGISVSTEVDQKIVDQYFKKGQRNWYDNQSKNKIEKSTSYWFDTKNLGKKPMGKTKSNV